MIYIQLLYAGSKTGWLKPEENRGVLRLAAKWSYQDKPEKSFLSRAVHVDSKNYFKNDLEDLKTPVASCKFGTERWDK